LVAASPYRIARFGLLLRYLAENHGKTQLTFLLAVLLLMLRRDASFGWCTMFLVMETFR
jgi:hypothetical protein